MRTWSVAVALLVGLATPAHAKRVACEPTLPAPLFTPGDSTPPPAPTIRRITIEDRAIWIDAELAPGTELVHITYESGPGVMTELWTRPGHMFVCMPTNASDILDVSVAAVDAHGNASSTTATADVVPAHLGRRHGCGIGMMALLLLGIPVFTIGLVIGLLVVSALRRRKLRLPGEPVPPLAAEAITRATIDNTLITIAVTFALSMLLYFTADRFYAALVAWVPITRVVRLFGLRRFLATVELGVQAELHDNLLAVHRDYIVVPRAIIRDAQRRSVPTAAIDRRR